MEDFDLLVQNNSHCALKEEDQVFSVQREALYQKKIQPIKQQVIRIVSIAYTIAGTLQALTEWTNPIVYKTVEITLCLVAVYLLDVASLIPSSQKSRPGIKRKQAN